MLRGGWGRFYFHSGQFTNGLDASAGVASLDITPSSIGAQHLFAKDLSSLPVTITPASPAGVDPRDDRQPYTDSWSFTIAQRTPWRSLLEVAYVGNRSRDLANFGGAGSNINIVPLGAMLSAPNPATADPAFYRPLNTPDPNDPTKALGYGDLNLATNNLYANYNALQVTWGRHAGRYILQANYTLQKALGIVATNANGLPNGSASINELDLRSNYGVQPTDRRHLFNVAYSIDLGNPVRGNSFLRGAVNGWQLSGITSVQSGANLTLRGGYNSSTNFGMDVSNLVIPGSGIGVNNKSILGTNAIQLNPIVTCDPTSGLGGHQYINPNCFAPPVNVGENGPTLLPTVYGPHYFNSDLALFKNFQITESKKVQFRVQAYNFLNHPLWSFPDATNLTLKYVNDSSGNIILDPNTSGNFGKATSKQGARVLELAVKFFF